MNPNPELQAQRLQEQTPNLIAQGWFPLGHWRFVSPCGSIHDLGAADLNQLGRIELEGLFRV